jgi:hypothetical protein
MHAILPALTASPSGVDVVVKDTSAMPTPRVGLLRQRLSPPNERSGGHVLPPYRRRQKDDLWTQFYPLLDQ